MSEMKYILPALAIFAIAGIGMAYAENFTVNMTENGFSQNSLTIADGDSVTFVNTHMKTNGNLEPHAISDPFANPYTSAPSSSNHKLSQLPLNPVLPVTRTFLPLKQLLNIN